MGESTKKLVLIDGMALAYRGYFAFMRNPRITSYKLNTSAIFVFANTLIDILSREKPTHFAVVFDTPEPTFRHRMYQEYKATRESMPEDLKKSLPYLDRLCDAFQIPVLRSPGWEADDVIGTLSLQADQEGFTTLMVTPDKDYAQLVSKTSLLYKPSRTGGFDIFDSETICQEWQVSDPLGVIDVLGLMGDTSDNIPGVPGIGKKTAQKLIATYGTVENLLDNLQQLSGKQKDTLLENRDQALLSKKLVTIERNVPLESGPSDLAFTQWDQEKLQELFAELEFQTLGQRLFGAEFSAEGQEAAGNLSNASSVEHSYRFINSQEERIWLFQELMKQQEVCFDLETTGLDEKTCRIVGIAFSWRAHEAFFLYFPEDETVSSEILEQFSGFFENTEILKIGHNLKFDMSVLRWNGQRTMGPIFDTMLAAYLCLPEERRSMDALSESMLSYSPISITKLIGEKGSQQITMREVPIEVLSEYAGEDADVTYQLYIKFKPLILEHQQEQVFFTIENPLVPVLVEMEYAGINLDAGVLVDLSVSLSRDIEVISAVIQEAAGEEFNLNSPKQLGEVLFDKLQLDAQAKRTKKTGQYITNEQVLTRLAQKHIIAERILDYRMKSKLKSTYVDMLPDSVFESTGRIHTTYEQAVTATGRMQSHNPNLQNIPIRRQEGREIRRAFVPADNNHLLLAADYSQIELRIAAALSEETALIEAFQKNLDIHSATAVGLFGVPLEAVTSDMRRQAKTVNFGILYGISAFGLADRSELNRTEAAELINSYFAQYPRLKEWQEEIIQFAHDNGYVQTATGRRRYLRDINSRNATVRNAEERNAINSPVQGTAADMIKLAMVTIQQQIDRRKLASRMLLQVHDELVFDLVKEESQELETLVNDAMVGALPLGVPIVVEMGRGENWLEAH